VPVADSFEHGKEPSGSIKGGNPMTARYGEAGDENRAKLNFWFEIDVIMVNIS
jgi:hypothetical protein